MNQDGIANSPKNKEYAGQVIDVPRTKQRISFTDRLKKMTDEEGDPYLNVFSKMSVYLVTLFDFETHSSITANLPLTDMPLINTKTKLASAEIFKYECGMVGHEEPKSEQTEENPKKDSISPAFTKLKIGKLAGKAPGDLLLETDDVKNVKEEFVKQVSFLKSKLSSYPKNQEQINAIEDAINAYDLGILKDMKPSKSEENITSELSDPHGAIKIYATPVKHYKKQKNEKNKCYSIKITCTPSKDYPYRIEIMNCYAPLGHLASGIMPVYMDKAEDIVKQFVDLTEGEWLCVLDWLNNNTKCTRYLWYPELRQLDEANRWKG